MKYVFQVLAYDYDETYVGEIFESEEEAQKMAQFHNQRADWVFKDGFEIEKMEVFDTVEEAIEHYRKEYGE